MNKDEARRQQVLDKIGRAAADRDRLKAELKKVEDKTLLPLIVRAAEQGITLRDIGDAAGVSHVTIMRILQRHGYHFG